MKHKGLPFRKQILSLTPILHTHSRAFGCNHATVSGAGLSKHRQGKDHPRERKTEGEKEREREKNKCKAKGNEKKGEIQRDL